MEPTSRGRSAFSTPSVRLGGRVQLNGVAYLGARAVGFQVVHLRRLDSGLPQGFLDNLHLGIGALGTVSPALAPSWLIAVNPG